MLRLSPWLKVDSLQVTCLEPIMVFRSASGLLLMLDAICADALLLSLRRSRVKLQLYTGKPHPATPNLVSIITTPSTPPLAGRDPSIDILTPSRCTAAILECVSDHQYDTSVRLGVS